MTLDGTNAGRTRPTLAALACAVLLALLWVLRPPLPEVDSLTGPLRGTALEEIALLVAWVAATIALVRLLYKAVRAAAARPSRRRRDEHERLERVLDSREVIPRGGQSAHQRYSPPLKLTVRPIDHRENGAVSGAPPAGAPPTVGHTRSPDTAAIRISLLGPFRIDGADTNADAHLRSACEQLIAHLALHPRGATRDELIEAIWPDQDPHKARQRFWQNVSDARRLLGDALISNRGHYALDRNKATVDVDELEQLLAQAITIDEPKAQRPTLERALRLFRGAPLAGWDHVWADTDTRRLRSAHAELLERAGRARLVTGDAHGALRAAQQGLALDAYNEALWRLAMVADGRLGLRDSVGQRYRQLRSLLDEELGLEPERATRALYHELLGQR
jgi:DNA-binding SARP family transcriptional activator